MLTYSPSTFFTWGSSLLFWTLLPGITPTAHAQTTADSSRQHRSYAAVLLSGWAVAARTTLAETPRVNPRPNIAQQAAIPAVLLTLAVLGTEKVDALEIDEALREEVQEHVHLRTNLDDQLRHVPAYTSLGLSLAGVKGEHTTLNQLLLFGLAYTINNTLTSNLKRLTHVERPQSTGFDSFPSQHTSAAFSAATFLHREYGRQSLWYSVGGYTTATATGGLRIAKDKHWLSDVMAGAGVGILSTELAYWAYPWLHRQLVRGLGERTVLLPNYWNGAVSATVIVAL